MVVVINDRDFLFLSISCWNCLIFSRRELCHDSFVIAMEISISFAIRSSFLETLLWIDWIIVNWWERGACRNVRGCHRPRRFVLLPPFRPSQCPTDCAGVYCCLRSVCLTASVLGCVQSRSKLPRRRCDRCPFRGSETASTAQAHHLMLFAAQCDRTVSKWVVPHCLNCVRLDLMSNRFPQ